METLLILVLLAGLGSLAAFSCSRAAKLSRLANYQGCTFNRHKTSITTRLTAGRLEFFTQFFHQYRNVFTYTDALAFIRVSDDSVYPDEKPGTKPLPVTLFTAEMRNIQFPPLKIAPLSSPFARSQYPLLKTNIPSIDAAYRLHTPSQAAGILLTPLLTGLLKTNRTLYLECNDNALVYHEHTLIKPHEMESFRFRAMQLLGEFEKLMTRLEQRAQAQEDGQPLPVLPPQEEDVQQRAAEFLKSFSASHPAPAVPSPAARWSWLLVVLALFLGITFLSWFILSQVAGR